MTTLEIVSILVATAAVFGWISQRWLKLPITIGTMLLAVLVSIALVAASPIAPGIHAWAVSLVRQFDFESLILRGMLPLLLFGGAFMLDIEELAREKLTVALLSIIGTVLSVFLVASLMRWLGGNHAPWIECLLFGALISPTDPIAVLEMLRRTGVPRPIQAQLAGESLFNDGIGAVLFITLLEVARGNAPTPWRVAGLLVLQAGGGIAFGVVTAWIAAFLMRRSNPHQVDILLTLALAFGGYTLAGLAHVSAPLEAVAAGIALRQFNRSQPDTSIAHDTIDGFWTVIDEIQNSLLFVLLGLEAVAISFNSSILHAGIVAILSTNTVRFAIVALLLGVVHLFQPHHRSSIPILSWGGLRGGLSIALALSVPEAFGRSWILGATYLVVVCSIVFQGASMDFLLHRLDNRRPATD